MIIVNCHRCGQPVESGQFYTRAFVRNDFVRDMTDRGEIYVSIHLDCPTQQSSV